MSGVWGNNIKISIFGESHGQSIGIVMSNIPPGIEIDEAFIQSELNRRKPGKSKHETPRKEGDRFDIRSGVFNGYTTGAPLMMLIDNTSQRSKDYDKLKETPRPGHADFTANIKYSGYQDHRGGGHFSGRITAGLVFAGAIAKLAIKRMDIQVGAYIRSVHDYETGERSNLSFEASELLQFSEQSFPTLDQTSREAMGNIIDKHREEGDSVGGTIRCIALNVPAGLGDPYFESFESHLSHLAFSIPAVKGIEFGSGFDISTLTGSEANDEFYFEGNAIKTYTNHSGGLLGGITNGMPIDFTLAFKPTPSISKEQRTVNLAELKDDKIEIHGRHDPCILTRAVPIVEAVAALTIFDYLVGEEKNIERWMV